MPNVGPVPDVSPGAGPVGNVEGVSMFQKPPEGRRFRTGLLATVILAAAVLGVSCSAQPWSSVPKGSGGFSLHISFPVSGTAASRALASSARLLLPSATTLKVAMVPADKRFDTLQSSVDISASATTASVTFPSVAVGDWGIDAVASDASGNQLFGGITEITISPSTTGATLYLVPLGAKDFAVTDSSPALIPQSIGAGASFSWTVPAAALYLDKSFDVWLATTGLEEHLQFFDGTTMTSPSQSVGKGAGSYVTVYNPGTSAATANIILDPYRLTYNSNAGTGTTTYVDPIGYMPGGSYADATVLQASDVGFSKTAYYVGTWNTEPDGSGASCAPTSLLAIKAPTTLYAQWTPISYQITYNLDGGTNNAANPATYSVTTSTITLAAPTQTGYSFLGWYSDAGFTTQVTQIPAGSTGAITLYAEWQGIGSVTISFTVNPVDPQALSFSPSSVTIASGYTATLQTSNSTLLSLGGSWQWYVDGVQVSGATSSSFTYDPATYGLGQHTVTVKVLYNSLWYSGDLMVTAAQ